jgi:hypothetical protein
MTEEEIKDRAEATALVIKEKWSEAKIRNLKDVYDRWGVGGVIYMLKTTNFENEINKIQSIYYELFVDTLMDFLN